MKRILSLLILFILFPYIASADLEAHFLDVGQGDAAIIICDGEAMIIDGGPPSASRLMFSYIKNTLGLELIKLMVATHPHEDHMSKM